MRFIFDIDGTLTFDGSTIDNSIMSVLLKAEEFGHEVSFASVRSYRACVKLLGDVLSKKLVIGLNGGMAYDQGQLVFEHHLDATAYQEAISYAKEYNLPYFVDDSLNYATANEEHLFFIDLVDPLKMAEKVPAEELDKPIKMVCYMGNHEDVLADISYQLTNIHGVDVFYNDASKFLHIGPSNVNKATAVQELLDEPFIAFGDDKSDIELFKESIYSVQVGSYTYLRSYADEQISSDAQAVSQEILRLFTEFKGR